MDSLYVGIDLAKKVFAVHGVNAGSEPVLIRPSVRRATLHELIALLPPCTVAMDACSGALRPHLGPFIPRMPDRVGDPLQRRSGINRFAIDPGWTTVACDEGEVVCSLT